MSVSNATLHHTCFLVNNLEKSAQALSKSLSVKWNIWTITPEKCMVNNNPSPFSFRVALTQIGDASLELICPVSGYSVYHDHMDKKGEGFHHTCLAYADLGSLQAAKDELLNKGYKMIQHGETEGAFEFCYFELGEADIILELLYLSGLPEPEQIIG